MKSKVLFIVTAVPAVLLCFILATGWHFLIFGGKLIPAVGMGAYMTIMFVLFLISLSSSRQTG